MTSDRGDSLDAALSARLSKVMKGRDNTAYSPQVRQRAEQLLFAQHEGHYGIWEDAPESLRAEFLQIAQQEIGG